MTQKREIRIYTAQIEDGTFIVVSTDSPRFCVVGATEKEAQDKATRAIEYFSKTERRKPAPKTVNVVTPAYEKELMCA